MTDSNKQTLKWVLAGGMALVLAFFALPILATMVWNAVSIAVGAGVLAGLWFFLPALAEWVATGSYWLWSQAIKGDPTGKLRRELKAHGEDIEKLEKVIAEVIASKTRLEADLKAQRQFFDAAEILDWQENIQEIGVAVTELRSFRDTQREEYAAFELLIKKLEAHDKMGKAYGKAADAISAAGKVGIKSDGTKLATNQIEDKLAESRARMAMMLSRKPLEKPVKHMGNADVVVETPKLSANPSQVLGGSLKPQGIPAENWAAPTPAASKNSWASKLDQI